jgi:hypothetical protein
MKKILFIVLVMIFLTIPSFVFAAPFFTCDPYPADQQVQGFKGTVNGLAFDTVYKLHTTGKAIIYDCVGLPADLKWDFQNVRAYNVRGESVGLPFIYPAKPQSLSGQKIEP